MKVDTENRKKIKHAIPICITVPRRIRAKMLKFQQKHLVNWSQIAAEAFETFINQQPR